MDSVLILGAGGHGKVVADILLSQGVSVLGFLDDNPARWNTTCLNLPVLGTIDSYKEYDPGGLILGIGDNAVRQAVVTRVGTEASSLWINAIHPQSTVASSVQMGQGIVVAAGVIINPETKVGHHTIINTGTTIDHDCSIEDYAHLAPGVHLAGGVTVAEGTLLGIGTVVCPYRCIGSWTVVGAGAVVIRDIPNQVVAKGLPARWE